MEDSETELLKLTYEILKICKEKEWVFHFSINTDNYLFIVDKELITYKKVRK